MSPPAWLVIDDPVAHRHEPGRTLPIDSVISRHSCRADARPALRPLQAALNRIADALVAGQPVPPDLTSALSVPLVNPTVYRWLGNVGWLAQSVRQGTLRELWQRPFAEPEGRETERASV